MTFKKKAIVLLAAVLAMGIGCSTMNQVGTIGDVDIYEVNTRDWMSPSSTTIVIHDKETGAVAKINGGMGSGGLGIVAQPAATVGAAYFIKEGLRRSGDTITDNSSVTNNTKSGAGASSGSVSGAAAVNSNKNYNSSKSTSIQAQDQVQGQLQGQGQLLDNSSKKLW